MAEIRQPTATETMTRDDGGFRASMLRWVFLAFLVRAVAALVVDNLARQKQVLCLFDDTRVYWYLAGRICAGLSYMVPQYDIPHFALRTPGYPLFLAGIRVVFGESTLAPRLIQAIFCACSAGLLMDLVRQTMGATDRGQQAILWAGRIAALEPFSIGLSILLLSESLFVPLVLLGLCGLERLTRSDGVVPIFSVSLLTGMVQGITVLVRPSWLLFVPLSCLWLWTQRGTAYEPGMRRLRLVFLFLGFVLIMSPWWVRNALVLGRFVPTALWMGASLYDGLNPDATGASDMRFMDDPEIRGLDEWTQDRFLRDQAVAFVVSEPLRVLQLATIKMVRFWSPWPNAQEFRYPILAVMGVLVSVPLYGVMIKGAWDLRLNHRALVLLLTPLLYVSILHLVFVGSIRYRLAVEVPAFGLAAFALSKKK